MIQNLRQNKLLKFIATMLVCLISAQSTQAESIKIGSRNFPESVLVAEILSSAIERESELEVDRKFNLGGVMINISAMQSKKLDIYPDYSGSLLHNILGEHSEKEYLENYIKEALKTRYQLSSSKSLGFDNSFVLAVHKSLAEKYQLKTISDLYNLPTDLKLRAAFKHSFIKRPDGYQRIKDVYGIEFKDLKAMEYNIALDNLLKGRLDIIDSFSTDSRIKNPEIVTLKDDRNALIDYTAVYVSRSEILERHPELQKILNTIENSLDNKTMLELNSRIEDGETYKAVAEDFLARLYDKTKASTLSREKPKENNWIERLKQDLPLLQKAFAQHIALSFLASLLASIFGVLIGIIISYREKGAKTVLAISSVTQTIPSLALLALLIPIVGLGFYPALTALFIYALLPIIQNTYTGIRNIEDKYIDLARSLALQENTILTQVKLPMARSMIIAGIKTSLVISVGTATLATFVGGGGLGDLIKAGIDLNSNYLICLGAIPAAVLALSCSMILSRFEKA